MSTTNILITGVSGYCGGPFLELLIRTRLPTDPSVVLLASVRSEEQAAAVTALAGTSLAQRVRPVWIDTSNADACRNAVLDNDVSVVVNFVHASSTSIAESFIQALSDSGKKLGTPVHYIHTSGAKAFSTHLGGDPSRCLSDTDDVCAAIQQQKGGLEAAQPYRETNPRVVELCDELGVRGYIVAPCIVYGPGTGFGNKVSIQDVALVRIAQGTGKMFAFEEDDATWPTCSVSDTARYYAALLAAILSPTPPPCNKAGFYFAISEDISWNALSRAFAARLHALGIIASAELQAPDYPAAAKALGVPEAMVDFEVAGRCNLRADKAKLLGWKPQHDAQYLLDHAAEEVDWILEHDKKAK